MTSTGRSRRRRFIRSFIRKTIFRLVLLFIVYVAAEVLSWIAFTVDSPESFSFWELQKKRLGVQESTRSRDLGGQLTRSQPVHPYFGFTNNPRANPRVNDYGFFGPLPRCPGLVAPDDGVVSVALFGGSVANNVANELAANLQRELPRLERFRGKTVEFHGLAIAAMKQPQQLLVQTYFASLGAHFDVVIVLDGFNEIVLTRRLADVGVFPLLPQNWPVRAGGVTDVEDAVEIGRLFAAEHDRADLARRFSHPWLLHSVTANVIWHFLDRGARREIAERREAVQRMLGRTSRSGGRWGVIGPRWPLETGAETVAWFAGHWGRCSRAMGELTARGGGEYFHFLQPNQYVPGSKRFTEEERRVAIEQKPRYREIVELGYPMLSRAGAALAADGIRFHDLTMMFADVEESVYRDTCCHLNAHGDDLLAAEITRLVVTALD